mgnify:CR=1 FL=1|jgi:hypothetical protein
MYQLRKMISIIFLLFIIFISLLFSNIFKQTLLEGMNTSSVGDIEKPSEGTVTDESGPVVETDSDSSGPVVETDSDSSGRVAENDSDSDGRVVENDSDSSGPVVENDSDSDGRVVETTDDEKKNDDTTSYKENFQTRLVGTPINYKNAPQTTTLDDSLRAKPEINGVFNHIFGFSKQQTFQVKHP